jgi:PAS domain-containing protein
VQATEPLPLHHSWPLLEQSRHFELGLVLNCAAIDAVKPAQVGDLGVHHAACWECDLSDNSLIWSGGVYDIFGLPRGSRITREETVALYCENSRAALERLRSYAIRHRRGFTLDAQIRPVSGGKRWMRIIGAPIHENDRPVRLHGLKLIISART